MPFNVGPSMGMMRNRFGPGGGGSFNERPPMGEGPMIGSPPPMSPQPPMGQPPMPGGGIVRMPGFQPPGGMGQGPMIGQPPMGNGMGAGDMSHIRPSWMPQNNSGVTGGMFPRQGGDIGGLFQRYNQMQGMQRPQFGGGMPPGRQMY